VGKAYDRAGELYCKFSHWRTKIGINWRNIEPQFRHSMRSSSFGEKAPPLTKLLLAAKIGLVDTMNLRCNHIVCAANLDIEPALKELSADIFPVNRSV